MLGKRHVASLGGKKLKADGAVLPGSSERPGETD